MQLENVRFLKLQKLSGELVGCYLLSQCATTGSAGSLMTTQATPAGERNNLVITSCNGGSIGPIVPDSYDHDPTSPYDMRKMNRFGPHTSAFITEMVQNLVSSFK